MKIAVVGLWHLGEIVSVSLSELGHTVLALDEKKEIIENFKKGIPPLEEPGLVDLLKKNIAIGNLNFNTDFSEVSSCEAVFFTFDTPVNEKDEPDLSVLFSAVEKIAPHINPHALLVVMSQVPVGTTKELVAVLKKNNPNWIGEAVYFPENLQLGSALKCFLTPDRFVVGADSETARVHLETIIKNINCPRQNMNIASAEMSKHALNAFLATSLSFIYNISDLCEETGADVTAITEALRSDKRIGSSAYLDSSLGFSGGTLMRDLKSLSAISKKFGRESLVVNSVLKTNEERRKLLLARLEKIFKSPLSKIKIGILGITYKPGTSTLRRSLGLELIKILQDAGALVTAFDPGAKSEEFKKEAGFDLSADPYEMSVDCRGILLVTPWPEFEQVDLNKLKSGMLSPFVFFDTRNFLKKSESEIKKAGFQYVGMGR